MIEGWMDYITGVDDPKKYENPYVSYRMAYPKSYKNNIFLTKFERDHFSSNSLIPRTTLNYTFVNAFPLALTATPVSYEESSVLKCSVSFNFIRYVQQRRQTLFSIDDLFEGEVNRDMIVNTAPAVPT